MKNSDPFFDLVYATALSSGLPDFLARLLACQAAFETNDFTSKNFRLNNNAFGYKFVKGAKWFQLPTPGIQSTESDKYAAYPSLQDSTKEIVAWIKRRQKEKKFPADLSEIETFQDYANLLKFCGYFGGKAEHYAIGMKKYYFENF